MKEEQKDAGSGPEERKRKASINQVRLCRPEHANVINTVPSL